MPKISENKLDLGTLTQMIVVEMRIGQILAEKALNSFSDTSITPGLFVILSLIDKNPGQKQGALAKAVMLDRSTMVPIIDHCEENEWLQRLPYKGDRRAHAIHLTKKGKALIEKLERNVLQLEEHIIHEMGKKDRNKFLELLKQFQGAVSNLNQTEVTS
ncbi:MAG: DNA-binding MarR family transcriptional regulator [Halioglobus sp.]|jgi:DNA-binding MarR family transcriptional regulator